MIIRVFLKNQPPPNATTGVQVLKVHPRRRRPPDRARRGRPVLDRRRVDPRVRQRLRPLGTFFFFVITLEPRVELYQSL